MTFFRLFWSFIIDTIFIAGNTIGVIPGWVVRECETFSVNNVLEGLLW